MGKRKPDRIIEMPSYFNELPSGSISPLLEVEDYDVEELLNTDDEELAEFANMYAPYFIFGDFYDKDDNEDVEDAQQSLLSLKLHLSSAVRLWELACSENVTLSDFDEVGIQICALDAKTNKGETQYSARYDLQSSGEALLGFLGEACSVINKRDDRSEDIVILTNRNHESALCIDIWSFTNTSKGRRECCERILDLLFEIYYFDVIAKTKKGVLRWHLNTIASGLWFSLGKRMENKTVATCTNCRTPIFSAEGKGRPKKHCNARCKMRTSRKNQEEWKNNVEREEDLKKGGISNDEN